MTLNEKVRSLEQQLIEPDRIKSQLTEKLGSVDFSEKTKLAADAAKYRHKAVEIEWTMLKDKEEALSIVCLSFLLFDRASVSFLNSIVIYLFIFWLVV